jgi:acyl carrier protein
MNRQESLQLLEEIMTLSPHTLTGDENLRDLENWDSLSSLHFAAVVEKKLGLPLSVRHVAACRTVGELLALVSSAVAKRVA